MPHTCFLTGVSAGLGKALAETALNRGWTVYGCSRRTPEALVERGLTFTSVDLADPAGAASKIKSLLQNVDSLDLVVLNAAKLGQIRDLADTPLDDLRETMEINVWSNKELLDALFAGQRRIDQVVAISSGASVNGNRGWNGYSVSKAALNMLIKLYAGEQPDTHFTSLAPGLIDTAMQDYLTALPADEKFAPLEILRKAKGTPDMPGPERAAEMLWEQFPKLKSVPSGDYADIRKL